MDFVFAKDHRQRFLFFGSDEFEGCPILFQGHGVEEFDATESDGGGGSGPSAFVFVKEEVLAEFFIRDFVRSPMKVS